MYHNDVRILCPWITTTGLQSTRPFIFPPPPFFSSLLMFLISNSWWVEGDPPSVERSWPGQSVCGKEESCGDVDEQDESNTGSKKAYKKAAGFERQTEWRNAVIYSVGFISRYQLGKEKDDWRRLVAVSNSCSQYLRGIPWFSYLPICGLGTEGMVTIL